MPLPLVVENMSLWNIADSHISWNLPPLGCICPMDRTCTLLSPLSTCMYLLV